MAEIGRRAVAALPVAILGLAAVWLAREFPPVPGQVYGPALFPTVLGVLLLGCAVGVALQTPSHEAAVGSRRGQMAALLYAITPAILLIGWESVGWPLLALLLGAALLRAGGVRWWRSILGGLFISALTWALFPMLLRVPLPRGPLSFLPY